MTQITIDLSKISRMEDRIRLGALDDTRKAAFDEYHRLLDVRDSAIDAASEALETAHNAAVMALTDKLNADKEALVETWEQANPEVATQFNAVDKLTDELADLPPDCIESANGEYAARCSITGLVLLDGDLFIEQDHHSTLETRYFLTAAIPLYPQSEDDDESENDAAADAAE
ncbi:MAG: hypothetical protein ABL901_02775 [Hyphomicrobiaceae bacterium]|nr:hypothetical protein [Hyphomicrobiaceae bacterium]